MTPDLRERLEALRERFNQLDFRPHNTDLATIDEALAALRREAPAEGAVDRRPLTPKSEDSFESWWPRYRKSCIRRDEYEIGRDVWLAAYMRYAPPAANAASAEKDQRASAAVPHPHNEGLHGAWSMPSPQSEAHQSAEPVCAICKGLFRPIEPAAGALSEAEIEDMRDLTDPTSKWQIICDMALAHLRSLAEEPVAWMKEIRDPETPHECVTEFVRYRGTLLDSAGWTRLYARKEE